MCSETELNSDKSEINCEVENKCIQKNSSEKKHRCHFEGCTSSFNRPWKLQRHINTHTKKRPFKCDFPGCTKDYTNNSHLQRHKCLSHSNKKPLPVFIPCPHPGCKKVFSNKYNVKRHLNSHKDNDPYKCTVCDVSFKKHGQLKDHLYTHLGMLPFVCETCKELFKTRKLLKRHEKKHTVYSCEHEGCEVVCDTWNALRKHFKIAHPRCYKCDFCGKTYVNKWTLTEHVLSHLPVEKRDVLPCPYNGCERYYFYRRNLEHHIRSFHREINFKCAINNCGQTFVTKAKLRKHEILHTQPKKTPSQVKKPRKPRGDKGIPRKSMAAMLSGIILPSHIDKSLAQSNITAEVLECIEKVKGVICKGINETETEKLNETSPKEICSV